MQINNIFNVKSIYSVSYNVINNKITKDLKQIKHFIIYVFSSLTNRPTDKIFIE